MTDQIIQPTERYVVRSCSGRPRRGDPHGWVWDRPSSVAYPGAPPARHD